MRPNPREDAAAWRDALKVAADRRLNTVYDGYRMVEARRFRDRKERAPLRMREGKLPGGVEVVLHSKVGKLDQLTKRLFGRKLTARDFVALSGAPAGTRHVAADAVDGALVLRVDHPYFQFYERTFELTDEFGSRRPTLIAKHDELFRSAVAPPHSGARALARMVAAYKNYGIKRIEAEAARGGDYNMVGYYVWPRLGFDAPLEAYDMASAPRALRKASSLHALFRLPGGRKYWRKHGWTIDASFDLTPGSRSMRRLEEYLAKLARDESAAKVTGLDVFSAPALRAPRPTHDSAFE